MTMVKGDRDGFGIENRAWEGLDGDSLTSPMFGFELSRVGHEWLVYDTSYSGGLQRSSFSIGYLIR